MVMMNGVVVNSDSMNMSSSLGGNLLRGSFFGGNLLGVKSMSCLLSMNSGSSDLFGMVIVL